MVSHSFFELISALGVTVPTSHHWPMGDEGKQAMLQGGVSGPPPYPSIQSDVTKISYTARQMVALLVVRKDGEAG